MESARPRETTKKEPEGAKEMGSAHASRFTSQKDARYRLLQNQIPKTTICSGFTGTPTWLWP